MMGKIPVRYHVIAVPENPVKGFAGGAQLFLGCGVNDFISEVINTGFSRPIRFREPLLFAEDECQ